MSVMVSCERPDSPDAVLLISELDEHLASLYPAESRHGFNIEALLAQEVPFFILRYNLVPAGCGGIKLFGTEYSEIKRMYVRPQFRNLGLARQMVQHLTDYAQAHNVKLLRLETGVHQLAAIALYEHMGFVRIPPFGEYKADPLSLFFEKPLG